MCFFESVFIDSEKLKSNQPHRFDCIFCSNKWIFAMPKKWLDIHYLSKKFDILFCSITSTNLGQFSKPGTELETAGPEVFKTPPTCAIWPSFGWDIWG